MRKSLSSNLRLIFLLGDILILCISATAASLIIPVGQRFASTGLAMEIGLLSSIWLLLSLVFNPYKFSRVSRFARIIRNHVSFIVIHATAVLAALYIFRVEGLTTYNLAVLFLSSFILMLVWRVFYFYLNKIIINQKLNFKNVVIVGFGDLAWEMRKFFRLHPEFGYRFLGYFDEKSQGKDVTALDELQAFCTSNNVDEIYCCLPYTNNVRVRSIVDFGLSNLIKVKLITDYRGFFSRGVSLETYDNIPVLNVAAVPLDERKNQMMKRAFDITFSLVVTIFILSWLIPIIAVAIKLNSRGPVFFKQKRAGKGNKPFNCMKFRTMVVHNSEFVQATKNDPRVTAVGAFLRKTSLDELPQFINVLKGQMSIIGPRPHPLKLNEEFSPKIEKFMARHYIKPGITGLAQAKGFRGETQTELSMRGRVKLDRFYIENWSFILDLKIIIATVISMIKGDQQAY
jgi:putative colanic acid biosysnthesis UDP-glucose lipid carrier transferase